MSEQVVNYKCPACTGPLHFSATSNKLECEYCGSSYEVEEIQAMMEEKEEQAVEAHHKIEESAWDFEGIQGGFEEEMKAYNCPSCGAQLFCDETTAATCCPYCNNPTVVPFQFENDLKPNYILPFELTKDVAKEKLKKHYKGKFLLPKAFSSENHIEELQGVYVPFWLFDADCSASMHFDAEILKSHREGDYIVTTIDHYDVYRSGTVGFEKVPVDGASKMDDAYMDSIEPYDYSALKEFSTVYLPGYLADIYDVDAQSASVRANERCENSCIDEIENTVHGYTSKHVTSKHISLKPQGVTYAFMPVYMLSTKWNNETYVFAMNGQTGKLVGDLPIDRKKQWLTFFVITIGVTLVIHLLFGTSIGLFIEGIVS